MSVWMISALITLALVVLTVFLGFMGATPTSAKSSSFECGFMASSLNGVPFSMPFFMISLMFLLFDVEILLVCFYPMVNSFTFFMGLYHWLILVLVLLATLYEWKNGVLSWV